MATGVPNRRRRAANGVARSAGAACELSYPSKSLSAEILATPAAVVSRIWHGQESSDLNRLYFAENLGVLAALCSDASVVGAVRLVYIDPPFATQTAFHTRNQAHAYDDGLSGSHYVEFLRQRLVLLRELLTDDGSIYLHLDGKMVFQMKIIMDEVFGPANFRNCITRKKCNPKNYTRRQYGNVADYLLFYSKSEVCLWNPPVEPWTTERAKEYQYVDRATGRRFMKVPVHAPGTRNGQTGEPWRGVFPPPGKHWQYSPATLDEMDARGDIFWSARGNPRRKVYLDENPGVGVQDIWMDFRDAHNQNVRITGYPTEKNPDLLRRIIQASSQPGDLVLDCFSGSGTTLAVASELKRHWIGVDSSQEAISTTLQRFTNGLERMGDFVSRRPVQPMLLDFPQPPKQMELGLDLDQDRDVVKGGSKIAPILDFALFADSPNKEAGHRLVSSWSASNDNQLAKA